MPSRPARPPPGLFGNPASAFSLDELTQTVRTLLGERPGQTTDELSRAVFTELALKPSRRATELVAEAIRLARPGQPPAEISGSAWQASSQDVRDWALRAGFETGTGGRIPEQAITAYNQTHPGHPY